MCSQVKRTIMTIAFMFLVIFFAGTVNVSAAGLPNGSYIFNAKQIKAVKAKGNKLTITMKNNNCLTRDPKGAMNQYFGIMGTKKYSQKKISMKVDKKCHLYHLNFIGSMLASYGEPKLDLGVKSAKELGDYLKKSKTRIYIRVKGNKICSMEYVGSQG